MRVSATILALFLATSSFAQAVEPAPAETPAPRRTLKVFTNSQTTNYLAKFDGVTPGSVSDSVLFEDSGKIGLGTTTPSNAFHVLIPDGATNLPIKAETTGADSITGVSLRNDARNWHVRVDGTDGDKFKIYDATAAAYRLTINDSGNVGINTSDPKSRLHISSAETADTFAGFGPDPTGVTGPAFNIGYAGFSFGRSAAFMNVRPDALATAPNPSIRLATANVERMIITNTGAIGFGTSAPSYKMHVYENADVSTVLEVQNPHAGVNAAGVLRTRSDVAATSFIAHGSGRTSPVRFGNAVGGWAEFLTFSGNGLMMGTSHSAPFILGTASASRIHITAAGDVGIGNSSPSAKLHVTGNIIATGSITGATVIGAVYQDVAEWVPAAIDMVPGTVVVLNLDKMNEVQPSSHSYDTSVAGVVSAAPGIILGVAGDAKEQVATTGRVKVRVDARTAPVRIGDLLVTSDTPGAAMRSEPMSINGRQFHQPGTIIGKALEPLESGVGEILVLLSMQ